MSATQGIWAEHVHDAPSTIEQSMVLIDRASKALSRPEVEAKIKDLVEQSQGVVAVTDPESREVCHEWLMVHKRMRVQTQNAAKAGRDEAVQYSKAVIAIEKELVALIEPEEKRLAAIRDAWDAAKEAEKQARIDAEVKRIEAIQGRIETIRNWPVKATGQTADSVFLMLEAARASVIDAAVFEEFTDTASAVLEASLAALSGILQQRKDHEAEQERIKAERAELAKLRAEQADRDRLAAAAQAKADADAQAEHDRLEAAAKVERDAESARLRQERAENERIARERQADLDRQAEEQRIANAAEVAALAEQRAAIERLQEAASKTQEPKPIAGRTAMAKTPDRQQIIEAVAKHFDVPTGIARYWLGSIRWTEAA